jgi:type II secretory ATPase GspE/PulE/Tfp pilus assembly ATPase PilB-like protein
MNVQKKIHEADTYFSMGMLQEALNLYEGILRAEPALEKAQGELLRNRTQELRMALENEEEVDRPRLTSRDLSIVQATLPEGNSIPDLVDSALALSELGLHQEAAQKLEAALASKQTHPAHPPADILARLLTLKLETEQPEAVLEEADQRLQGLDVDARGRATVLYRTGIALEKKGQSGQALEQYKTASTLDPEAAYIRDRLQKIQARLSGDSKFGYLLQQNRVTPESLQKALTLSKKTGASVETVLIQHFKVDKPEVGKSLSLFYGCPFRAFDLDLPVPVELIGKLKKAFLVHYSWVPLSWGKEGVEVLIDDPKDLRKTDHIKALLATGKIRFSVGIKEDIHQFIEHFFAPHREEELVNTLDNLDTIIPDVTFEEEADDEEEIDNIDESSSQVVKFVDQVLITAFRKNVSDIHIEPSPVTKATAIRFRMDGVCQEYIQVPNIMAPGILSRLKIMAGLDIAERRLPQDGKIKMKRKGIPEFELRISTMPTAGGFEDAVLRILAKAGAMKLSQMGMSERNLDVLKRLIVQPYGLVLVVGPTGSGKTTTLHAALGHINHTEIKIWTAEDPVEITQRGLRQVEVKPRIGLDFARVMRGFLRLDPDVIMIGEMRDKETASIGVEASLTGHLVFSTLHTNSAPETVTRLLDMGLNPLNFSDAFLGVLAQRLIRRLCTACRKAEHPDRSEFEQMASEYGPEAFEATGFQHDEDMKLYRPVGCERCSDAGYKGRMGIHELMEGTKTMKGLIKEAASTERLFPQAFADGMTTLKQDGILKVFQGYTDMNEIRRVCIE